MRKSKTGARCIHTVQIANFLVYLAYYILVVRLFECKSISKPTSNGGFNNEEDINDGNRCHLIFKITS